MKKNDQKLSPEAQTASLEAYHELPFPQNDWIFLLWDGVQVSLEYYFLTYNLMVQGRTCIRQ